MFLVLTHNSDCGYKQKLMLKHDVSKISSQFVECSWFIKDFGHIRCWANVNVFTQYTIYVFMMAFVTTRMIQMI